MNPFDTVTRNAHPATRPGRTMAATTLLCLALLAAADPAAAFSRGLDSVRERYPAATAVHHCGVCHTASSQPFPLTGPERRSINPFGSAWKARLTARGLVAGQQTVQQGVDALVDIESQDADGDGARNVDEFSTGAGFNPGDAASTPPTGPDREPPAAPSLVSPLDLGTRRVNLRWLPGRDNVGVVRFELYRQDPGSAVGRLLVTLPGSATGHVDTEVQAGARYIYLLRAVDAAGNRSDSLPQPADLSRAAAPVSLAYVPNAGDGTVSVIDVEERAPVATVAVGALPWGVAVSRDAQQVFVSNAGSATVSVIDTATQAVVATHAVGRGPRGLGLSPDGRRLFVANHDDDTVSVVDLQQPDLAPRTLAVGSRPYGLAVHPASGEVYVANSGSASVSVIDPAALAVVQTIATAATPWAMATSPDGALLYVSYFVGGGGGSVDRVSTALRTVQGTVRGLSQPGGVAVSADGATLWVTGFEDGTLHTIDAQRFVRTATTTTGAGAGGVAVDPVTGRVLVAGYGSQTLSEVDASPLAAAAVQAVLATGTRPLGLGAFVAAVPSVTSARDVDRLLEWAEDTYRTELQPAPDVNPATQRQGSTLYRHYARSDAYVGVRRGRVRYLAPETGRRVVDVGPFDALLQRAVDAGY